MKKQKNLEINYDFSLLKILYIGLITKDTNVCRGNENSCC